MSLTLLRFGRRAQRPALKRTSNQQVDPNIDPRLDALYRKIEADYGYVSPVHGETPGPIHYRRLGRAVFPGFQFEKIGGKFGRVRKVVLDLITLARHRAVSDEDLIVWMCERNDFFYGGRPADLLAGEPDHVLYKFRLSFQAPNNRN